jgi:hypothetical protein
MRHDPIDAALRLAMAAVALLAVLVVQGWLWWELLS